MTAPAPRADTRAAPSRWRPFLVSVLLGVLLTGLAQLLVDHEAALSPLDESAHIDYAITLAGGHPPTWDSRYQQETLRIVDCAGTAFSPATDCSAHERNAVDYPPQGYSYEAQHTPLGYLPAAAAWRLLSLPDRDPIAQLAALRLSNLAWIALYILAFSVVVSLVTRSGRAAAGVAAIAFANPTAAASWSYLTNDAGAPLAGALALLTAIAFVSVGADTSRRRWWGLVALAAASGAAFGLTKATFAVAPLALLAAWLISRGSVRAALASPVSRLLGLQLASVGAVVVAYQLLLNLVSDTSSSTVLFAVLSISLTDSFPWGTALNSVANGIQAFTSRAAPQPLGYLAAALSLMALGAAAGTNGRVRGLSLRAGHLLAGVAIAAVALGLAWPTINYVMGGFDFESQYRYLAPLIPVAAVAAAPLFARRPRVSAWFATVVASSLAGAAVLAS